MNLSQVRLGFLSRPHSLGAISLLLAGTGCGNVETSDPGPTGSSEHSYRVSGLCDVAEIAETEFVPLTKSELVTLLSDQLVSWMTPLHAGLLELNDAGILRAWVEVVSGVVVESCRQEQNYDILPPNEALIDPVQQANVRSDFAEFLSNAVEISSGEVLRLSFHECASCSEPVGRAPTYWTVRRTKSGTLLIEVELEEGRPWTKKVTISPNELTLQAELEPLTDWAATASEAAREGRTDYTRSKGTLTAGMRRDEQGRLSGSLGVRGFRLAAHEGEPNQTALSSASDCIGFEAKMAPKTEGSKLDADFGDLSLVVPGSSHCPNETSCGPKERTGPFEYELAGLSANFVQPSSTSAELFTLDVETRGESTGSVAGDVFGRGGLGKGGKGGSSLASVTESTEGYLITFSPALDMGGALAISSFSEEMRLTLPDWLSDEVFDLTFGGDPVPSILVPYRELCPEGAFTSVPRREVEIMNGQLQIVAGDRVLSASAGQCFGESLADPETFEHTSDFWDIGFTCSE